MQAEEETGSELTRRQGDVSLSEIPRGDRVRKPPHSCKEPAPGEPARLTLLAGFGVLDVGHGLRAQGPHSYPQLSEKGREDTAGVGVCRETTSRTAGALVGD